jgi:hypothetical protein
MPELPAPADWARDAEATAQRLGAFARGTRAGRAADGDAEPGTHT